MKGCTAMNNKISKISKIMDGLTVSSDGEIEGLNYCCFACAAAQAKQDGHTHCVFNERCSSLIETGLAYAVFDRDAWRLYTTTEYDLEMERAVLHERGAIMEVARLNAAMEYAYDAVNQIIDTIARDAMSDFILSREWIIQRPERELHSAAREGVRVFFTAYLERWRALQYLAITGETWEEARERLTSSQVIPWED